MRIDLVGKGWSLVGSCLDAKRDPTHEAYSLPQSMTCIQLTGGVIVGSDFTALLYDMLLGRHAAGVKAVLYISSLNDLRTDYGSLLASHIEQNYLGVQI
ncbi:MAG: hypothetical protein WA900_04745 [Casimicrobiaceae bacterium]